MNLKNKYRHSYIELNPPENFELNKQRNAMSLTLRGNFVLQGVLKERRSPRLSQVDIGVQTSLCLKFLQQLFSTFPFHFVPFSRTSSLICVKLAA